MSEDQKVDKAALLREYYKCPISAKRSFFENWIRSKNVKYEIIFDFVVCDVLPGSGHCTIWDIRTGSRMVFPKNWESACSLVRDLEGGEQWFSDIISEYGYTRKEDAL